MPSFANHVPDLLKEDWVSIRDAGKILAVSRKTVMQLISDETLETRKYFGNRTFVSRASCEKVLKNAVA
jgi:hypothetical protein